jgi:hypothetical protein
MSIADARRTLADAFDQVAANVYAYPPQVVVPPAVVIVPDEPYLELVSIGSNVRIRSRHRLTVAVQAIDNQATLELLENLCVAVYANLPTGVTAGEFSRPQTQQVGPSDLLVSDVTVEVITTQEGN